LGPSLTGDWHAISGPDTLLISADRDGNTSAGIWSDDRDHFFIKAFAASTPDRALLAVWQISKVVGEEMTFVGNGTFSSTACNEAELQVEVSHEPLVILFRQDYAFCAGN
jgi:hypothetical protein